MKSLVFIHLSDIHFHSRSDSSFDLDRELRHELARDAKELTKHHDPVAGVLVCGDIAHSGQQNEYDIAAKSLKELCSTINCRDESVFLVPGNHDVDRGIIRRSAILTEHRNGLRLAKENAAEKLQTLLQDSLAEEIFYKPLQAYNLFASRYGCQVSAKKPFWDKDLPLNDGSTLRLRGLTSVLASDGNDNREAGKLVLGSFQTQCLREDGVAWLTLCHHPPDWLFDQDDVEDALGAQTQVQLFGHKHKQRLHLTETRLNKYLRLGSGALHPERDGTWEPRYNILSLAVEGTGGARRLVVTVWARRWRAEMKRFDADGSDLQHRYDIPLAPWTNLAAVHAAADPPAESPTKQLPVAGPDILTSHRDVVAPAPLPASAGEPKMELRRPKSTRWTPPFRATLQPSYHPTMDPYRRLVFRFATLPYLDQVRIVGELGLVDKTDQGLDESARLTAYFVRARERQQLAELWDAVEKAHPEVAHEVNPFSVVKIANDSEDC